MIRETCSHTCSNVFCRPCSGRSPQDMGSVSLDEQGPLRCRSSTLPFRVKLRFKVFAQLEHLDFVSVQGQKRAAKWKGRLLGPTSNGRERLRTAMSARTFALYLAGWIWTQPPWTQLSSPDPSCRTGRIRSPDKPYPGPDKMQGPAPSRSSARLSSTTQHSLRSDDI